MMRKVFLPLILLLGFICAQAQDAVTCEITSGIASSTTRQRIERQTAALLSAINRAESANTDINYYGINIDDLASQTIGMSWNQSKFRIEDSEIVTFAITLKKRNGTIRGYQIRNIGVNMTGKDYDGDVRQEISIDFNANGKITDFNFTMPTHVYVGLLKAGEQLDDLDRRLQIIHWCEQFAKAYRDKNKKFMQSIFSDDALIITGIIKMEHKKSKIEFRNSSRVEYVKQNKTQYLNKLFNIFDSVKYVNVRFDDYRIVRHPSKPQYYGVTLTQKWATNKYQDLGTLFLVWDFSDEDKPKIHVRTWQPLTEAAFMLSDFKLP